VPGGYFYHQRFRNANPAAQDPELQGRLLNYCRDLSGVALAWSVRDPERPFAARFARSAGETEMRRASQRHTGLHSIANLGFRS
jgi:hypothetical protein